MKLIGILLVLLGGAALYFRGIPFKTREEVVSVGPLHASADVDRSVALPPWVGAALVGVGVLVLVVPGGSGARRRR